MVHAARIEVVSRDLAAGVDGSWFRARSSRDIKCREGAIPVPQKAVLGRNRVPEDSDDRSLSVDTQRIGAVDGAGRVKLGDLPAGCPVSGLLRTTWSEGRHISE